MNWKPARFLIEGRLDNSQQDKVMGWMKFAGLREKVTLDIEGNFHRDVRGTKIRFTGDAYEDQAEIDSKDYFRGFALHQTGKVVIELEPVLIEVIDRVRAGPGPIPCPRPGGGP